MHDIILDIRDLEVTFPKLGGNSEVVSGVNLQLRRGEVLGLVGESGSGKSISSLACLGLVPTPAIVDGSIKLSGQEIVGKPESELSKLRGGEIAMVFQNPMTSLNPYFTIGSQLLGPIQIHRKLTGHEAEQVAVSSLHKVRLPDPELVMERYPHELSGGQIQRVMIALALACKPNVLIADEPTTALDVTVQAQILILLRELLETEDMSILFITHDLGVVATLCDRVAVMYAGKIVETANIDAIFSGPAHPYTRRLLDTVPRLGVPADSLPAIEGQVPDMSRLPAGCAFHPRCCLADDSCRNSVPKLVHGNASHSVACHHPSHFGKLSPGAA
jgi:oligopeptide/dipeptide ABC transporter ATP-binding protein